MADRTDVGQGLEGDSLSGHSRDPLVLTTAGMVLHNNVRCFRFTARFFVKAKIETPLSPNVARIEPTASTSLNDEVNCDRALIHSLRHKYAKKLAPGSSAHRANFWTFPQQTAIIITAAHQVIRNAQEKVRAREAARLLGGG